MVLEPKQGRVIAKLGDFGGIDKDGAPIGFLWSNSLVFHGEMQPASRFLPYGLHYRSEFHLHAHVLQAFSKQIREGLESPFEGPEPRAAGF